MPLIKVQVQGKGEASGEASTQLMENGSNKKEKGPYLGVIWFTLTFVAFIVASAVADYDVLYLIIGYRSVIALSGFLIMQIGLWHAENKWDEEGSAAYIEAAGQDPGSTPEHLESTGFGEVAIPEDKLKAAFPIPWGFLVGWWVWGVSYLFPIDGTLDIDPTVFGIIALVVCFLISFVASIPMSDAVMNRVAKKKGILSIMFLLGWITLGIVSALDVTKQLDDNDNYPKVDQQGVWILCMLGPFTVILSQKILFGARKMGTLWEESGKPNFHPVRVGLSPTQLMSPIGNSAMSDVVEFSKAPIYFLFSKELDS